jgi:hypothetical protein
MPRITLKNTNGCVSELTHDTKIRSTFHAYAIEGPKRPTQVIEQMVWRNRTEAKTTLRQMQELQICDSCAARKPAKYKKGE